MTAAALKETLHHLVDDLDDEQSHEALEFLQWLTEPAELNQETLARVDQGEAEIEAGDFVTLAEIERQRGG